MSNVIDTLVEMGFSREKAELAIKKTNTEDIQICTEWLLAHGDEEEATCPPPPPEVTDSAPSETQETQLTEASATDASALQAKSIKCDDCGKLFRTQEECEFHASKSGHENFSESTEEKKPLTEEEKKEQLAKIEAKLRQRRLDREAKEKQEALEREKNRIRSGKELLEAKRKQEELEMKKIVEQKRREKEEEKLARQRVKEQIEQDRLARRAKFSSNQETSQPPQQQAPVAAPATSHAPKPVATYSEVQLQIRLTNGSSLVQTFGAKEPLSAVRLYVELNTKDGTGPFSLMTNYPKRVFKPEDYEMPLEMLGLGPRATIIVSKTANENLPDY